MEQHPRESAIPPTGQLVDSEETVTQGDIASSYPGTEDALDSGSQRQPASLEPVDEASGSTYEMPLGYGENRLTLLVRDPHWLYAYWELTDEIPSSSDGAYRCILRVHLSDKTGSFVQKVSDVSVEAKVSNWFINVPTGNRTYVAELGRLYRDGTFIPIIRSNLVHTPPSTISEKVDVEWMTTDDDFLRLYAKGVMTYLDGSEEHLKGKLVLSNLSEYLSSPMGHL